MTTRILSEIDSCAPEKAFTIDVLAGIALPRRHADPALEISGTQLTIQMLNKTEPRLMLKGFHG
jgi:hypothetical protein